LTDKLRFPARFDAGAFREDMAGTTPAGQSAAEIARRDYLAFGVRHHPAGSNAPTLYEIAHRRLHD
jgi:hypothetical protein